LPNGSCTAFFVSFGAEKSQKTKDLAVAMANVLETSAEYLVSGKRPEHLTETEKRLMVKAQKWKAVLEEVGVWKP
jgi:hypothetical protein